MTTEREINAQFEKQKNALQESRNAGTIDDAEYKKRVMKLASLRSVALAGAKRSQKLQAEKQAKEDAIALLTNCSVQDQLK